MRVFFLAKDCNFNKTGDIVILHTMPDPIRFCYKIQIYYILSVSS